MKQQTTKLSEKVINFFIYLFLSFWTLMVVFPMLWVISSSLKTDKEIFMSPWQLPAQLGFENFVRAWSKANIGLYFFNSLAVILPAIFFTLLFSAMAGYVLARFAFPGNRFIFYSFLGGMLFPVMLALVPLFFLLQSFKIIDSHFGLILVYIAYSLPFTIFFMTGFLKTLPTELLEAAIIDGAGPIRLFFQVVLPLLRPVMVTVIVVQSVAIFNDFTNPLYYLPGKQNVTVQLTLFNFQGQFNTSLHLLFMNILLITIPPLIVYLFFNRQIVAGMTAGAVKG